MAMASSSISSDPANHINVSSFYQIDHSKLPSKSSLHLTSIRLVLVYEKTRNRVSLRYPSLTSLREFFTAHNLKKKKLPALDERFVLGSEVAADALYRRIPPHELAQNSHSWRFWVLPSAQYPPPPSSSISTRSCNNIRLHRHPNRTTTTPAALSNRKSASLCSQLRGSGVLKWGQRRQVMFLARHVDDNPSLKSSSHDHVKAEEDHGEADENDDDIDANHAATEDDDDDDEDEDEDEEEEEDDDEEEKEGETVDNPKAKMMSCKRKRNSKAYKPRTQKKRMKKHENKNQIVAYKPRNTQLIKKSVDRWPAERYKLAEENILKVMKEQGAVHRNPILRPALRAESRKLIGDTGLLDHLLKHMAGKEAPGGEERFRRRHNADGAMEYWLENANLVDIRKEAGVQDPYWVPPPGWKPGDNPSQDPLCARKIKELKQEIAKLKMDMKELESKRHEEELPIVNMPITSSVTAQNIDDGSLLLPLKAMYIDLVNRKAKVEEQMMELPNSLCGMEEKMEKLKATMEEANRTGSTERWQVQTGSLESTPQTRSRRETREITKQMREEVIREELRGEHCDVGDQAAGNTDSSAAPTEDKAAKIERLKSGFRICKPQGSFLWPNMGAVSSPHHQVVVQLEDLFTVTTPPSVSSTTAATKSHHLLCPPSYGPYPTSPVKKPLAEKRPTIISPSTAITESTPTPSSLDQMSHTFKKNENTSITTTTSCVTTTATSTTTTRTARSSLINLNEPFDYPSDDNGSYVCSHDQSRGHNSSYPVTYQRRNHHHHHHHHPGATSAGMAGMGATKKDYEQQRALALTTSSC